MSSPDRLSFEEEEHFARQLDEAWDEANFLADMEAIENGPLGPTGKVLADLIPDWRGPSLATLTEATAEAAIDDLLNALAAESVLLDRPSMVPALEFYEWLVTEFLREDVDFVVGNGWRVNYSYTELVPDSPDAMSFHVEVFLDDLFNLNFEPRFWTLSAYRHTGVNGDLPPFLENYIDGWRLGLRRVDKYTYIPLSGKFVTATEASFQFEVAAELTYEDGRRVAIDGRGHARLEYDGYFWSIKRIAFPGFRLPTA